MKKISILLVLIAFSLLLVSCNGGIRGHYFNPTYESLNEQDEFQEITENPFVKTSEQPTSNMSLSANTASYSYIRNMIKQNKDVAANAVRIEEMINYFKYDYQKPEGDQKFGFNSYYMPTPWNNDTGLLFIGMQAEDIVFTDVRHNLVFLIDVSGSMSSENKLPLVQQSFTLLLEQLGPQDRVSIVTYASNDRIALEGATGDEKLKIEAVIQDLYASGSTAGSKGIQTAYQVAEKYFIEGGNNRVILATDGDFNVGISSTSGLEEFITEKRDTGIYLSVLGFGYGNLKDNKLETLARHGNGNHAYIDSLLEARKSLVENLNGTLYTVAKDAKAQLDFSNSRVLEYRLIGYENRMLTDEEFEDEDTDAGEIGAGHQVTVVYEVKLSDDSIISLGSVKVRYKNPNQETDAVLEQTHQINLADYSAIPEDYHFISAIIEFGLILRNSEYKRSANIDNIIERITPLSKVKNDPYRAEFLEIVTKYKQKR